MRQEAYEKEQAFKSESKKLTEAAQVAREAASASSVQRARAEFTADQLAAKKQALELEISKLNGATASSPSLVVSAMLIAWRTK